MSRSVRNIEFGDFLRLRRAAVTQPAMATQLGHRRRVQGLRREEVAVAANISTSYYISLEQGRGGDVSFHVLDRLAAVLCLDSFEREHLTGLARLTSRTASAPTVREVDARVDPTLSSLMSSLREVPAVVTSVGGDVLMLNPLSAALFDAVSETHSPGSPPNIARSVFLAPSARTFFQNWTDKAEAVAGYLRYSRGRDPDNANLRELVTELKDSSPVFGKMWARAAVTPCNPMTITLNHPDVGQLTMAQQTVLATHERQQQLTFFSPVPGAQSAVAFRRLRDHVNQCDRARI